MNHDVSLITTIVGGLGLAFLFGAAAHRLRLSPVVGYLLAGIALGPYTPGFIVNQQLAAELAEIGVTLLMFGIGLHFSLKDLLSVRRIALPGALIQMAAASSLGGLLGYALHWTLAEGLIFGLALSVASTVVSLRSLHDHHIMNSERSNIIIGWLIVQDMAMIFVLVLLPSVAPFLLRAANGQAISEVFWLLALTLGKVAAFVAVMLYSGPRLIPLVLHYIAHTGSRELFRLGVLAIALGVAFGAAYLFGVSFALGAFFAGMVMSESELSHRAAQETLPLRDAFAVLFFVSVGMLVDPGIIVKQPAALAATLAIILLGKTVAAYGLVRLLGHGRRDSLSMATNLAQIGEFSFILAGLAVSLGLLPAQGRDLILASALLSIMINPFLMPVTEWLGARRKPRMVKAPLSLEDAVSIVDDTPAGHTVLVGYGRVGSVIGAALQARKVPFVVIEDSHRVQLRLARLNIPYIAGNAVRPDVIKAAGLARAHYLFVAIPHAFEAGQLVQQARRANPELMIIARAHSKDEIDHLARLGATHVTMDESEIAHGMLSSAFE